MLENYFTNVQDISGIWNLECSNFLGFGNSVLWPVCFGVKDLLVISCHSMRKQEKFGSTDKYQRKNNNKAENRFAIVLNYQWIDSMVSKNKFSPYFKNYL